MKTIWIVLISVLVSGGLIGGGTYYFVKAKADKDKDRLQTQINTLNSKVSEAEKNLVAAQSNTNANTASTKNDITSTANHTGMKLYNYSKIGLSFYYPEGLGNPTLDEYSGTTGNGFSIYFSNNKDLRIGTVTTDFSGDRGGAPWESNDLNYKNGQCASYKDTKDSEYKYYVNCEIVNNENSLSAYYKESTFFDEPYSFGMLKVTKSGSDYRVINISAPKTSDSKKQVIDILQTMNVK